MPRELCTGKVVIKLPCENIVSTLSTRYSTAQPL